MVRLQFEGKTRRVALLRVAWALAIGGWPRGVVRARDGDDNNCRFDNLILTEAGPRPFDWGKGGEASSLERRAKTTTTLIRTLADHPGSTVPQLSRLVGSNAPCVCTRLGKLADAGFCVGPKCDARARWDLTERGRELAATGRPALDDCDRQVLAALAQASMGPMRLSRRVRRVSADDQTARSLAGRTWFGVRRPQEVLRAHRRWQAGDRHHHPAAPRALAPARTDQRRQRQGRA